MLLAIDLHEHFVNVECVAVASMFALQSLRVEGSKLDAPEPNGFIADCDTTLGQEVFNIAMTEVEAIVEPDSVRRR